MFLYPVGDCVMHLCPFCNRRTINVTDDDDDANCQLLIKLNEIGMTHDVQKFRQKMWEL